MTTTSTGRIEGTARPYRVFISYSSGDRIVAKPIAKQLEERGAIVFLDHDRLEYGERFREVILPEIARSDELLVILTPAALRRAWIFAEIGVALHSGIRIVAVLYAGATVESLKQVGALSLIGDVHNVMDPNRLEDRLDEYYEQVTVRVVERQGT